MLLFLLVLITIAAQLILGYRSVKLLKGSWFYYKETGRVNWLVNDLLMIIVCWPLMLYSDYLIITQVIFA